MKKPHQPESVPPLMMQEGDLLQCERRNTEWDGWLWCTSDVGITAWVPEAYLLDLPDTCKYRALRDYTSFELPVALGEEVTILYEVASWAWVRTSAGGEGWVPLENLKEPPESI